MVLAGAISSGLLLLDASMKGFFNLPRKRSFSGAFIAAFNEPGILSRFN